jgi:hypothetical protein
MTDSPDASQRRAARSRIWAGGQLRRGGEVESLQGGLGLEAGAADAALQGHGLAAGDLVLAQDLEEVQVAEFPGAGLGEAGVEGGEHAGQLEAAQRGRERAAVGDRDGGGHDGAPFAVTGVTASLGIAPGMGMTFANDAGPRRNAAAPGPFRWFWPSARSGRRGERRSGASRQRSHLKRVVLCYGWSMTLMAPSCFFWKISYP